MAYDLVWYRLYINVAILFWKRYTSIEESFNMHLPYIAFGFGLLLISLSWLKEGIVALKIASVAATTIAILLAAFLWGWTYIKILVVFLVCLFIILVISIFIKRSKQKIKRK